MSKNKIRLNRSAVGPVLLFAAALFLSAATQATPAEEEIDKADNTISINVEDLSKRIVKDLTADYFTFYHGPTLKEFNSPYSVDNTGHLNQRAVTGLDGELNLDYLVNRSSGVGFGPVVPFVYAPIPERGFILGDVGLKFFEKKAIDSGNFRLYTNIILQAPTSDYSQMLGMKYAIKTTPYFWYNISNTRFKVGAWTEAKYYAQVLGDKDIKLYAAPYVNYRVSDKFALNLEYEMETHHPIGATALQFVGYQQDLQPGFIWFITEHMSINPYLQLITNNIATNTTGIGAVFSATLL